MHAALVRQPGRGRDGFTLVELLVAVIVLIVVILAASKIFGTASRVTGVGEATADVLQEAAAIERRIRADFDRLSREGFLAIRCVGVPNSVNVPDGGGLLNPSLPPDAVIRADQLVFFTQGVETPQTLRGPSVTGSSRKGQGTAARIYYGHAFQVPDGPAADLDEAPDVVFAIDPVFVPGSPLTPWHFEPPTRLFEEIRFQQNATAPPGDYVAGATFDDVDVVQPAAPRWLLARQAVVLVDDDDIGGTPGPNVYLFDLGQGEPGIRSTATIADEVVINGRVDAAAMELSNVRASTVTASVGGGTVARPWSSSGFSQGDQRDLIGSAVFYPRAERVAPSTHRVDQALTNHVLAGACSSFIVEWTWKDGVGFTPDPDDLNNPFLGVDTDPSLEHPWIGLSDEATDVDRGVLTLREYVEGFGLVLDGDGAPIFVDAIEPPLLSADGQNLVAAGATVYEAFFGYNDDLPLNDVPGDPLFNQPDLALGYTPWPSAIRITMRLHDQEGRLENGRVVQFVIDLSKR